MPSLLVLVRHAQSEGNIIDSQARASRKTATWAYPLTPVGVEQARITAKYIQDEYRGFDACYTSYYVRARETMHLIQPGKAFIEDSRLAEANRGIYHAMTKVQIAQKYPEELERKEIEGLYHYHPPGGENWMDVEIRVHSFLETLFRLHFGKRVLCVVHGHWMILFKKVIDKLAAGDAVAMYERGVMENASVIEYQSTPSGELREHYYVIPWQIAPAPDDAII